MSTAVFVPPPGTGWPITRTPSWNTGVQQAISGKECRLSFFTYPRWKYELTINLARSSAAYQSTEYQYVVGFFNALQGQTGSFLYQDADDNAVTAQALGTGNGSTTGFQLVRTFGGFIEPVLAPNVVSNIYVNGIAVPQAGVAAPTNGALTSSAGGTLGATTYYVRSTWVTGTGESLPSTETSLVVAANHILNVAAPSSPPASALGWNVYVSNTTMGGSGAETLQDGQGVTTPWVEPTSGLVTTTAVPPIANTTGWSVSTWGSTNPGVLTFSGNMALSSGLPITATFSYYWPCRMSADDLATSLFMQSYYEIKKFTFISCKN